MLDSGQGAGKFFEVDDAIVFGFGLPPIFGLSTSGGFEFMLEDRAGRDVPQLADVSDPDRGNPQRPEFTKVVSIFRDTVPQYQVNLDTDKAQTLGIPVTDVYNSLQTFLGGLYVNDFNRFGRTWQVLVQGQPDFRNNPDDVKRFYVRAATGDMVPLSTLVTVTSLTGPEVMYRYNRFRTSKTSSARMRRGSVRSSRHRDGGGRSLGFAARFRFRMDRHCVPAETRRGQGRVHVGFTAPFSAGVSVPRRTLRKLVHFLCGRSGSTARIIRSAGG